MRRFALLAAGTLLLVMPSSAIAQKLNLAAECRRVHAVYPNLMVATMMEGEMDCAGHGEEFVSCNAGESAAEKAARERRLTIRRHQEAGYKVADDACRAWEENRKDPARIDALKHAIEQARATDRWRPEQTPASGSQ